MYFVQDSAPHYRTRISICGKFL